MKLSPLLENLKLKYNLPLIPSLVRRGKGWLLDLIFPRYCLGCKRELPTVLSPKYRVRQIDSPNQTVCDGCFDKIALNSGVQCHICGLRNSKGTCCKRCRRKTPLKGLLAAGQYENPILKEMIRLFKYQSVESLKKPLAELIINYLKKENLTDKFSARRPADGNNFILVPVPLTLRRKSVRGFNQSELLAEEIGRFLNCPVINLLKRKKFASPQAEISDWQKRKENISGAFALSTFAISTSAADTIEVSQAASRLIMIPKKVILVDDVSTSGATLEEAARVLKEAGVKEVYGLVVAKG